MKNAKGGYQIITLAGLDLAVGTDELIESIYKALEGNYKKPILVEGITIDGVEKESRFVNVHVEDSVYVLEDLYGYDVTIADDGTIDVREHGEYIDASTYLISSTHLDLDDNDYYVNEIPFGTKPVLKSCLVTIKDGSDNLVSYVFHPNVSDERLETSIMTINLEELEIVSIKIL